MAQARWSHINFDSNGGRQLAVETNVTFRNENVKMNQGYTIALSPYVAKFLEEWRKYCETEYPIKPQSLFIFPSPKLRQDTSKRPGTKTRLEDFGASAASYVPTQGVAVGYRRRNPSSYWDTSSLKNDMNERYITRQNTPE